MAWNICSMYLWTIDTQININTKFLKSNMSCLGLTVRN